MTQSVVNAKRLSTYHQQSGFTLVELLIALVLGLLISAAALQIFYTSTMNARRQEAGSQIQDNAIFGLSDLQYRLRRINYGAHADGVGQKFFMNHLTPQGGIVLTAPKGTVKSTDASGNEIDIPSWANGNLYGLKLKDTKINTSLLSKNASTNSVSNLKDVKNSDQLTIQYQSDLDGTFDCQGREIPKGYYVIERYFVRQDTSVTPKQSGLACASAIYKYDDSLAGGANGIDIKEYTPPGKTEAVANNLDGNGTIIIPNVDYFRVLLGISSSKDFAIYPENMKVGYIPIPDDPTALVNKRIVSMQIGLLTHSDNPTVTSQSNNDLRFNILDKRDKSLDESSKKGSKYLRNVYESTVLFRNARGGI